MDDELLLSVGTERERLLLRAGLDEAPSDQAVRAAASALGLLPSAAAAGAGVTHGLAAAKWLKLTSLKMVAFVAAPVVVAAGSVGAVHLASGGGAPAASSARPIVVVSSMPAAIPAPVATPDETPASPAPPLDNQATSRLAGASVPVVAVGPATSKHGPDTFDAQVALIDSARAMAAAGDSGGVLRAVAEYERRFPGGVLSEEASLLRIEAVAARGDRASASLLARQFLAAHPRSVHSDRVRSLLR